MLSYILFSLFLGCIVAVTSFKSETPKSLSPIWLGLGAFVLFSIINYTTMPVLDFWRFDGVWIQIAIASTIGCSVSFLDDTFDGIEVTPVYKMWQAIPLAACILLCVIRIATSAEMFHSSSYKALLKPETVTDTTFTTQIHPIPVDKMISIKREYAEDLASKRIENMPSLGSRCKFGRADMINLNGSFDVKTAEGKYETLTFENEQVWIMPLEHRGLWKWLDNKVTNGYCIVSTHNPNRIFFVTEVAGNELALRYLNSGCFGDQIERYVRSNGYASYGLTEYSMELDDCGLPYWVITIFEPKIGFSGKEAIGVLVVDMQTGDIKEYGIADAPDWVDRIQPDNFLIDQINDWGQYQDGWVNAKFTQNGVREATPGMSLVYSNGRSYWYSGIQSVGADKSTSGFMLIDTRTKKCELHPVAGINEQAAKEVIEAQSEWVRMSKFEANNPVLYNVHGIPTYFMSLTGDGIKNAGYAFVSLKSELHFAAAATPLKALKEYLNVVQRDNQFLINDGDKISEEVLEVTVRGIVYENGTYYVIFKELKGKEFTGTTDAFPELKWGKEGQKVKISYSNTDANVISLDSFDIIDFDI